MQKLRSYKEAFEPARVRKISELIEEFEKLSTLRMGYRVYTSEIQGCLLGGLLLAAESVSYSLLELFIRDLAVGYTIISRHGGDGRLKGRVERELESDRNMGFSAMLHMISPAIIERTDAEQLREFYRLTRIPLAHALVRRMTATISGEFDDMFAEIARHGTLETKIDDQVISDLQFIILMMKKYLPSIEEVRGTTPPTTLG